MTAAGFLKPLLRPLYAPFMPLRLELRRRAELREQKRCVLAHRPVPFTYYGRRLYIAPDDHALLHITASSDKISRLAALVPETSQVVFDVGAHSGLFSHLVQRRCPSAQVVAFEPNLDLQETLLLNRLNGTEIVNAAVGARSGSIPFFVDTRSTQASSAVREVAAVFAAPGTMVTRDVPLISLDEYCAERGISQIDALKIDVQGFERDVIEGARSMLPSVKVLLLEATFLDIASVQLALDLRSRFEFAYAVNDVYLGGDLVLTHHPLPETDSYVVRMW